MSTSQPTQTTTQLQTAGSLGWKPDWVQAKKNHEAWWHGQGLVLSINAPKDTPWITGPPPVCPKDPKERWLNIEYRIAYEIHQLGQRYFGADTIPALDINTGPGSLANFLGGNSKCDMNTIWYEPCIENLQKYPPLVAAYDHPWVKSQMALLDAALTQADGRFLVGLPDLIENIDIISAMRDPQTLMYDLVDDPTEVLDRIEQINRAYFEVYDMMYSKLKDEQGGSLFWAFSVWGPGKTAKVQCDAGAMFSSDMFKQFVVPALTEQCDWLDFSMFHLDGEECIPHLDHLLEIPSLNAIEWTPKFCYTTEGGGHPKWYDLYRRILKAGKSVQAICVGYDEVIPLLDAVGSQGMYIVTAAKNETAARKLEEKVQAYR